MTKQGFDYMAAVQQDNNWKYNSSKLTLLNERGTIGSAGSYEVKEIFFITTLRITLQLLKLC
jgi:hypothetical protein